jgi:hypothetical protein
MNLLEFTRRFPDEKICKNHLKEVREKEGIICKNCGVETKHWWLENVQKFQCSECNSRTNLKSGTMMEKSKVPLQIWFMCIHLMTSTKKPISCLEMMRQLGISKYETTSLMMNKIRLSMGKRDSEYKLSGVIEMDDSFFEVVNLPKKDSLGNNIDENKGLTKEKRKRGRGSQRQQKVLVFCESEPRKQVNPNKKSRSLGYIKMIVVDSLTNKEVNYEITKNVEFKSHIISDSFRGFSRVKEVVEKHTSEVVRPKECMKKLPWVHTMISNCKRQLLGTHHSINKKYLQTYLNEFCYKLNRRNFETDLFDRMLISGVSK